MNLTDSTTSAHQERAPDTDVALTNVPRHLPRFKDNRVPQTVLLPCPMSGTANCATLIHGRLGRTNLRSVFDHETRFKPQSFGPAQFNAFYRKCSRHGGVYFRPRRRISEAAMCGSHRPRSRQAETRRYRCAGARSTAILGAGCWRDLRVSIAAFAGRRSFGDSVLRVETFRGLDVFSLAGMCFLQVRGQIGTSMVR